MGHTNEGWVSEVTRIQSAPKGKVKDKRMAAHPKCRGTTAEPDGPGEEIIATSTCQKKRNKKSAQKKDHNREMEEKFIPCHFKKWKDV